MRCLFYNCYYLINPNRWNSNKMISYSRTRICNFKNEFNTKRKIELRSTKRILYNEKNMRQKPTRTTKICMWVFECFNQINVCITWHIHTHVRLMFCFLTNKHFGSTLSVFHFCFVAIYILFRIRKKMLLQWNCLVVNCSRRFHFVILYTDWPQTREVPVKII